MGGGGGPHAEKGGYTLICKVYSEISHPIIRQSEVLKYKRNKDIQIIGTIIINKVGLYTVRTKHRASNSKT